MVISGDDLEFLGPVTPALLQHLMTMLTEVWSEGWVHEDEEPTHLQPLSLHVVPSTSVFFVYRDQSSFETWEQEGRTEQHAQHMIMVRYDSDGIYFTSEGEGLELVKRVLEVLQARL